MAGTHSLSMASRSAWKGGADGGCMMRGPGSAASGSAPAGGGGINALMS
jgi:hypothetical protein